MQQLDPKQTTEQLVNFLKTNLHKAGFSRAVIALSGGVDSATSCALSVRALGADNVYPILLPYGALGTQGVLDAMTVVEKLQIPLSHVTRIDIRPVVDAIVASEGLMDNIKKGNIMARVRMTILFDQAKKRNALVIGTENRSEHLLGYFTRYGDEASDIEPLRALFKTQVNHLAQHLGVPEAILSKKPTAGLWEGQTDEGELGFTYEQADEILHLLYDEKKTVEEIIRQGLDAQVVTKVKAWVDKNSFKHRLPLCP